MKFLWPGLCATFITKSVLNLAHRLCRAEIEKSIHIGYLLWRIASSTQKIFCLLESLPRLVMLILIRKHINEAGNIMQDLATVAPQDVDISGRN